MVHRPSKARGSLRGRLDSNVIFYGGGNSLDTAEVALCRLDDCLILKSQKTKGCGMV
jgi:hypothetical protein